MPETRTQRDLTEPQLQAMTLGVRRPNPYRKWIGSEISQSPLVGSLAAGALNLIDPRVNRSGYDAYAGNQARVQQAIMNAEISFRNDSLQRPFQQHLMDQLQGLGPTEAEMAAVTLSSEFNVPDIRQASGFTSPPLEAERAGSLKDYQEKMRAAGKAERGRGAQERLGTAPLTEETSPTEQFLAYDIPLSETPSPGKVAETKRTEDVAAEEARKARGFTRSERLAGQEFQMKKAREFAEPTSIVDQRSGAVLTGPLDLMNEMMRTDPTRWAKASTRISQETRDIPATIQTDAFKKFQAGTALESSIQQTMQAIDDATLGLKGKARRLAQDTGESLLGLLPEEVSSVFDSQRKQTIAELKAMPIEAFESPEERDKILGRFDARLPLLAQAENRIAYLLAMSRESGRLSDQDVERAKAELRLDEYLSNPKDALVRLQGILQSAQPGMEMNSRIIAASFPPELVPLILGPQWAGRLGVAPPTAGAAPAGVGPSPEQQQEIDEMRGRVASGEISEDEAAEELERLFGGSGAQ